MSETSPRHAAFAAFGLLLILTGCGGESTPGPSGAAVEKGRAIYLSVCALCHGKTADGMPSLGKGLRDNAYTRGLSDDELIELIKTGRSASDPLNVTGIDMPPYGGDTSLTDEDLKNLVAYLRTL